MNDYVFTVSLDHPSLPGHFPGNPVVPGVVILQHVLGAADAYLAAVGGGRVGGVANAKFLRPLTPGRTALVRMERDRRGRLRFECRLREEGGAVVASGVLNCVDTPTP